MTDFLLVAKAWETWWICFGNHKTIYIKNSVGNGMETTIDECLAEQIESMYRGLA